MDKEKYTNYSYWKSFPLNEKGKENFPLLYHKCTGLLLEPNWIDPPGIFSLQKMSLPYLRKAGYRPEEILPLTWKNSNIAIPLFCKYRHIGGFLIPYKRIGKNVDMRWVKYTYPAEVGAETPLAAISGASGVNVICYLVDTLKGFFKLINWYHCQKKYSLTKQNYLIIYIDQGEHETMKLIQRCQLRFKTLIDLTETGVKDQLKDYKMPYLKEFIYFENSPIYIVDSKELLERAIKYTSQKL